MRDNAAVTAAFFFGACGLRRNPALARAGVAVAGVIHRSIEMRVGMPSSCLNTCSAASQSITTRRSAVAATILR